MRAFLSLALSLGVAEIPPHRRDLRWRPAAVLPVGEPTPGLSARRHGPVTMRDR